MATADASDAPSKKNATGTCKKREICSSRLAQFPLADAEHQPPHAHSAANVHVNGFWSHDGGHWLSPSTKELLCRNAPTIGDEAAGPETTTALELNEIECCICGKVRG